MDSFYRSARLEAKRRADELPLRMPERMPKMCLTIPATSVHYYPRLKKCLERVRVQPPEDLSIVFVWEGPDGGWMPMAEILLDGKVHIVEADPDEGPFCLARARNIGALAAPEDTEILIFTDADILLPYMIFARTAAAMERHPSRFVTALTVALEPCGKPGKLLQAGFGGFLAVRREHFLAINGYDEEYRGWGVEDNDFVDRLVWNELEHYDLTEQEGVVVSHQWHKTNVAGQEAAVARNRRRYATVCTIKRNEKGEWGVRRWPKSGRSSSRARGARRTG